MLFEEFGEFSLFGLEETDGFADEGRQSSRLQFDAVVPGSRWWQPFSASLFEDIVIITVLEGDIVGSAGGSFSFCDYPMLSIHLSGEELGFSRVDGSQHNGELVVGDPPASPVDLGLRCCKPGVPQDDSTVP